MCIWLQINRVSCQDVADLLQVIDFVFLLVLANFVYLLQTFEKVAQNALHIEESGVCVCVYFQCATWQ